jgi:hypothetical protein
VKQRSVPQPRSPKPRLKASKSSSKAASSPAGVPCFRASARRGFPRSAGHPPQQAVALQADHLGAAEEVHELVGVRGRRASL